MSSQELILQEQQRQQLEQARKENDEWELAQKFYEKGIAPPQVAVGAPSVASKLGQLYKGESQARQQQFREYQKFVESLPDLSQGYSFQEYQKGQIPKGYQGVSTAKGVMIQKIPTPQEQRQKKVSFRESELRKRLAQQDVRFSRQYYEQRQVDTVKTSKGKEVPVMQVEKVTPFEYIDRQRATPEEERYFREQQKEEVIASEKPITTFQKVKELGVRGYEAYEAKEREISKGTVSPIISPVRERIESIETTRKIPSFVKGTAVGVLTDIETRPLKNIGLVGAGYAVGFGSATLLKGASKIPLVGKIAKPVVSKGLSITGLGLTGLYAYDVGRETIRAKTYEEKGGVLGLAIKDITLIGFGAYKGQEGISKDIEKVIIEDKPYKIITPKFEGKRPIKTIAEKFADETPLIFKKGEILGKDISLLKLDLKANVPPKPFTFEVEKVYKPKIVLERKVLTSEDFRLLGLKKIEKPPRPIEFTIEPSFEVQRQATRFKAGLDVIQAKPSKKSGIKFDIVETKPKIKSLRKYTLDILEGKSKREPRPIEFTIEPSFEVQRQATRFKAGLDVIQAKPSKKSGIKFEVKSITEKKLSQSDIRKLALKSSELKPFDLKPIKFDIDKKKLYRLKMAKEDYLEGLKGGKIIESGGQQLIMKEPEVVQQLVKPLIKSKPKVIIKQEQIEREIIKEPQILKLESRQYQAQKQRTKLYEEVFPEQQIKQNQRLQLLLFPKFAQDQKSMQRSRQKSSQIQLSLQSQQVFQKQRIKQNQQFKQPQILSLNSIQKFNQLSNQRLKFKESEITKQIYRPRPEPKRPKFISLDIKPKKRFKREAETYTVFLKKKGKFRSISSGLTKRQALILGQRTALRDIARTFKIRKTGTTDVYGIEEDFMPSQKAFRQYKVRGGKKIDIQDTYIQKTSANLQSVTERSQLAEARRLKQLINM